MKLFKVTRNDGLCDYDEYDEFVVRAKNEAHVKELILRGEDAYSDDYTRKAKKPYSGFTEYNIVVTPLTAAGDAGVIVSSYRAG